MPDSDRLALAALLYDIGTFRHRSFGGEGDPRRQGAEWLLGKGLAGAEEIADLIAGGPKDKENVLQLNQAAILSEADSLSYCRERDTESPVAPPAATLLSPLFASTRSGDEAASSENTFWPLSPLEPGHTYPQTLSAGMGGKSQYAGLWKAFEGEFDILLPIGLAVGPLLVLLEKYCACMPGTMPLLTQDTSTVPVSLFDHARARTAIACCLHEFFLATHQQVLPKRNLSKNVADRRAAYYRLVMGELSGIRRFVYQVKHRNDVTTLHARSFLVELLARHVAEEIVDRLGLTWANVMYANDGRFCVLAQNTQGARMRLAKIQQRFNEWLLEAFDGALHLAVAHAEARGVDLATGQMGDVWREVSDELEEKKRQRFAGKLDGILVPKEPLLKDGYCSVCRGDHFDVDLRDGLCSCCYVLAGVGDDLVDARLLVARRSKVEGVPHIKVPRSDESWCYYAVVRDEDLVKQGDPYRVYLLDSWDLSEYRWDGSSQWLAGRYVTKAPIAPDRAGEDSARVGRTGAPSNVRLERAATLDELAEASRGRDEIGVLEMCCHDLDALSVTYAQRAGVAGICSLNRQTQLFFKGYANQICRGIVAKGYSALKISQRPVDAARNVSILHSGSGGVLVVGAWDDAVELAFDVRHCLRAFAGRQIDAFLSGAVAVAGPGYPLHKMTELTRSAVLRAGGNSLTLFCNRGPASWTDGRRRSRREYTWEEARGRVATAVEEITALCVIPPQEGRVTLHWTEQLLRGLRPILAEWEEGGAYCLPSLAYVLAGVREALRRGEPVDLSHWQKVSGLLMNTSRMEDLRTILIWLSLLAGTSGGEGV